MRLWDPFSEEEASLAAAELKRQVNVVTGICALFCWNSPSPLDMVCGHGACEHHSATVLCLINFSKCVDSETHDKTSLWVYWVIAGCSSLRYILCHMTKHLGPSWHWKIPCAFSPRGRECSIISLKNRFYFPTCWLSCFLMLSLSQFLFAASWKPEWWL